MASLIVELEDNGQDFLRFYVSQEKGAWKIQKTEPFQGWLWDGKFIHHESIQVGKLPVLGELNKRGKISPIGPLKHKIKALRQQGADNG